MKKVFALFLCLSLCALCLGMIACGEEEDLADWSYKINDDGETCTVSYRPTSNEATDELSLDVPRQINGYPVTGIANSAFKACEHITSITLPNSVTSIGNSAFYGCSGLNNINIPGSVTSIGNSAFADCISLNGIMIPDSVTHIGASAFNGCRALKSVHISSMATWYGISFGDFHANPLWNEGELYVNGKLTTEIVVPSNVTRIGDHAFGGCSSITSITLPDSVTSIGADAFRECVNLTSVHIPSVETWCGISFAEANSNPLTGYKASLYLNGEPLTEIVIPDSISSIGDYAFYGYKALTNITIPDSVKSIGKSAFYNCSGLMGITVEDGNTTYHSAGNCLIETDTKVLIKGGNSSVIPTDGDVTSIADYAFFNCMELSSITIPDSVTSIGKYAFNGCTALSHLTLGNSLQTVGNSAFQYCTRLQTVMIPLSVTEIGSYAFDVTGLTHVYYGGTEKEWITIVKSNNSDLTSAQKYYYSEGKPVGAGYYWHYVDGEPTMWPW